MGIGGDIRGLVVLCFYARKKYVAGFFLSFLRCFLTLIRFHAVFWGFFILTPIFKLLNTFFFPQGYLSHFLVFFCSPLFSLLFFSSRIPSLTFYPSPLLSPSLFFFFVSEN